MEVSLLVGNERYTGKPDSEIYRGGNMTTEELRQALANKLKGIMPAIILDYVNNNEQIQIQDMLVVTYQLLPLFNQWLEEQDALHKTKGYFSYEPLRLKI